MSEQRRIIVIAGPNGAGKTTFAREFLPQEANCPDFINADLIAAGLSPFSPEAAAHRAGRLMLEEMASRVEQGRGFAFETTLSGFNYSRRIPYWKHQGYHIKLLFLSLPSVEMAIARVSARVAQGGYSIPEPVIRRRFESGLHNFHHVYKPLVDDWTHYDNSGAAPMLIESQGRHMSESPPTPTPPRDPDLANAIHALRRSARKALEIALQTGTPCYIWRDGRIVNIGAPERVEPPPAG